MTGASCRGRSYDRLVSPGVTVVMVQRDRFNRAAEAVRRVYENTSGEFNFVYVDSGSPRRVQRQIDSLQSELGFLLLRSRHHLTPTQARRIGLGEVSTDFVAFVDNDALVSPGWLGYLIHAAEETGAWIVGPLPGEGDPIPERVHMAGGRIELSGAPGRRHFDDPMVLEHAPIEQADGAVRCQTDFVEFHCMLVRTEVIEELGGFDNELWCSREHLDFCMRARAAGGQVWVEPRSVVTFAYPPVLESSDLPYFVRRWSERWAEATVEHFCDKYELLPEYRARGRAVVRSIRQDGLFERPRTFATRHLGAGRGEAVDKALRATVGRVEPVINRLFAGGPRPDPGFERITPETRSAGRR
ncbi:MAG: glycosyltransferase [Acidimicrobiales bacterium]